MEFNLSGEFCNKVAKNINSILTTCVFTEALMHSLGLPKLKFHKFII